jgi:hypothetical protein
MHATTFTDGRAKQTATHTTAKDYCKLNIINVTAKLTCNTVQLYQTGHDQPHAQQQIFNYIMHLLYQTARTSLMALAIVLVKYSNQIYTA